MRRFILGIAILMAVPDYAVGQQRERSGRSATGRTAVPREEAVQAASRDEKSGDAAASRAGREHRRTPRAPQPAYERVIEAQLRAASARAYPLMSPAIPHGRPGQKDGDNWPRYRRPHSGTNVVYVPYAAPVLFEREVVVEREYVNEAAGAPVIVEQPAPARLILDIDAPMAQVFSDGYYIGIPEDFRFELGGGVLEPGPHRIDIFARDHEPVSFDVNLARGQSATFRRTLTPIARAPQAVPDAAVKAPPAPKQPVTFYLIPGCYMGNVPPKEANLPATCDIARAVSTQY
jgi:hypothetical protein